MTKIEEVKKIASMVWAFSLNLRMEGEGKLLKFTPDNFWEQKLINKNPYFDFARQICRQFPKSPDNPDGYEPKPDETEAKAIDCLVECAKYQECYPFVNPIMCTIKEPKPDDIIEDGFGTSAPAICPICGLRAMYVCRPGDIRCAHCYDGNYEPEPDEDKEAK